MSEVNALPPAFLQCDRSYSLGDSLLGTPSDEIWPGVQSYPDFKASFPRWVRDLSAPLCNNLDDNGLDLLEMMLVYDPASRISAKQACNHPYFEDYHNRRGAPVFANAFH